MRDLTKLKNYKCIPVVVVVLYLLGSVSFAQVGINTTNPYATLDVRSSNQAAPTNTDGILIPKVDDFPTTNPTIDQDGMLIFTTGNGTPNKGFYYWDNSLISWVPIIGTVGGGGNTLDQAYDQNGVGLGRTINATNGALRINGDDGFLVTGSFGSGDTIDTEITGAGTRLFFNPNKAAFRSGIIFDLSPFLPIDQWNDANIGNYSTAFGTNALASGITSTAFGSFTSATGPSSTAFGSFTTASGSTSTVFGSETLASGDLSTAFGNETVASGTTSTAFGSFTSASDAYTTAFGFQSSASGVSSTAFGRGTVAHSFSETAIGLFNSAYSPISTTTFHPSDRLFIVGNGNNSAARSDAFTIYKSGLISMSNTLGIATNSPTATLSVNGTANKPGGGTWAVFSDRRLKDNIHDYNEGMELILKVKPVTFSYNAKMKSLLGENQWLNHRIYQGVIAQDLQQIAPDMVREVTLDSGTYLEVDPNKFTYALINAVKEQQEIITKQQDEIKDLQKQLKQQQGEIETIKTLIKSINK